MQRYEYFILCLLALALESYSHLLDFGYALNYNK